MVGVHRVVVVESKNVLLKTLKTIVSGFLTISLGALKTT